MREKQNIEKFLIDLEKNRVNEILKEYGYLSLGDVVIYADKGDAEAISLLRWYKKYDDAVWQWIDEVLPKLTKKELRSLDPMQVERGIFEKLKNELPK